MDVTDEAFNAALSRFVKAHENLDFEPEVLGTDWRDGRDVQIGDYTWDHDSAEFEVRYRDPAGRPSAVATMSIDLEHHGFGQLIRDIIGFWP
jgi:hypothetical protein